MKIIKNEKLIKRNGTIGGWLLAAAVLFMGGGLYIISGKAAANIQSFYLLMTAFIVGFVLMLIGQYLGKRYGGIPRPDEKIDSALKGLPGDYVVYHFKTSVAHLLVGPAGIWALIPYNQRGLVTYTKNRWRVSKGGFAQAYMTIFGLEGIGRPDFEAENEIAKIKKHLVKSLDETEIPEIKAALLFTNEQIEIQSKDAPIPALKLKQLKDFFRQKAKEKPISQTQLVAVKAVLPE